MSSLAAFLAWDPLNRRAYVDAAEPAPTIETFLRRDSHGGFGVFFDVPSRGVIRRIAKRHDGTTDGRDKLAVGDTIVRVGGAPCESAEAVMRLMTQAEAPLLAVTALRTSASPAAATRGPDTAPREQKEDDSPLPGQRVPLARLRALVLPAQDPAASLPWASSSGSHDGDQDLIESEARRTLAPPVADDLGAPSGAGNQSVRSAPGACAAGVAKAAYPSTKPPPNATLAAAIGRELARQGSRAEALAAGPRAPPGAPGGDEPLSAMDSAADLGYARPVSRLARAVRHFTATATVAVRADFCCAADAESATKAVLNVGALVVPDVLLVQSLLAVADVLKRSAVGARRRDAVYGLEEVSRRVKRARDLASLSASLRDASARELSHADCDATLHAAFVALREAIVAADLARVAAREAHRLISAHDRTLADVFLSSSEDVAASEAEGSATCVADQKVAREDMTLDEAPTLDVPEDPLVAEARRCAAAFAGLFASRVGASLRCVVELEQLCAGDLDRAAAALAAAEALWAGEDRIAREALRAHFEEREHSLADSQKVSALSLARDTDDVIALAEASSESLLARLGNADDGRLKEYFDLTQESLAARAALLQRQIRQREAAILALDQAARDADCAWRDDERQRAARGKTRARLRERTAANAKLLRLAAIACSRASMIKRTALRSTRDDVAAAAQDVVATAEAIVELDADLRLAHARLVVFAADFEFKRAAQLRARFPGGAACDATDRAKLLLQGVNATKIQLHRLREARGAARGADVAEALAELARVDGKMATIDIDGAEARGPSVYAVYDDGADD
ncbi:hypothetical protein M885DRAFT_613279 [Pelagophyceae sp. CCMP2097]|nr:hypothetical protein M885DRAFT_613279 [Pelagophyceae sp. CCMP2097]